MKETIENYNPQTALPFVKQKAQRVWIFFLSGVLIWNFLIIFAPIARNARFGEISAPIYKFFGFLCHQISARSFHIDDAPFAVCARCTGFYGGFLAGIIAYPFFRRLENLDSFPRFWLFAAMIPMVIDFSLTFFGIWENTHLSRLTTGLILGAACAFFIIPALVEIRLFFLRKRARR